MSADSVKSRSTNSGRWVVLFVLFLAACWRETSSLCIQFDSQDPAVSQSDTGYYVDPAASCPSAEEAF